jgi:hypothetical protein
MPPATMQKTMQKRKCVMGWGYAPSPLSAWGYPHPLAGESGASD